MGTQARRKLPDIIEDLIENPSKYGFYQAIRLLEQAWPGHGSLNGDLDKWLRLSPAPEISFPGADLRRCEYDENFRINLQCTFIGLYGVDAAVPHYFTEIAARDDDESEVFKDFLNIFCHRFYALFFMVWKKYNPAYYLESPDSKYRDYLSAISGRAAGTAGGEELAYAGILGNRISNSAGLMGIIRELVGTEKVGIEEYIPRWVTLDAIPSLGSSKYGGLKLGENSVIGKRVLDMSGKINIQVGPLPMREILQLLPRRKKGIELGDMIQRHLSPTIDYDVVLNVIPNPDFKISLGVTPVNLGWTTMLGNIKEDYYSITIPGQNYKDNLKPGSNKILSKAEALRKVA